MKASDNEYPSVLFDEQGSDPSTPASGFWRLYTKAGGLYLIDDAGAVIGPLEAGNALSRTLINRSTSQTITGSGTETVVSFDTQVDDDDGAWAIGTPTKIIIPSALNGRKGIVYAQIAFTGSSSGTYRRARILKAASELVTVTQGVSGTTASHIQVRTPVITFATSDEFTLAFNADVAGLTIIGGVNHFGLYTVD